MDEDVPLFSDALRYDLENLTLLCPPCVAIKSGRMTLQELRDVNRERGHLVPENEQHLQEGDGMMGG